MLFKNFLISEIRRFATMGMHVAGYGVTTLLNNNKQSIFLNAIKNYYTQYGKTQLLSQKKSIIFLAQNYNVSHAKVILTINGIIGDEAVKEFEKSKRKLNTTIAIIAISILLIGFLIGFLI